MYDAVTELMLALAESIRADEAFADEFGRLAARARGREEEGLASAFTSHARMHRVQLIQLRAQLGALVDAYGALHSQGS